MDIEILQLASLLLDAAHLYDLLGDYEKGQESREYAQLLVNSLGE